MCPSHLKKSAINILDALFTLSLANAALLDHGFLPELGFINIFSTGMLLSRDGIGGCAMALALHYACKCAKKARSAAKTN
jgi:hypothetical protein